MIPDLDIYRSAQTLVKHHGQDAPIHAAMRADELLDAGDLDGAGVAGPLICWGRPLPFGSLLGFNVVFLTGKCYFLKGIIASRRPLD